jgi:hypothetical protein
MVITTDERLAIHELVALHGHLMDEGRLDLLSDLFTDDVTYDLTPLGGSVLHGVASIREAAEQLGGRNPVAHLVTNTVVATQDGQVTARSKFLGVQQDGLVGSGTYDDVFAKTMRGWRISRRRVSLRREPLKP